MGFGLMWAWGLVGQTTSYVTVAGTLRVAEKEQAITSFYLDVYKLVGEEDRELLRTGRHTGATYRAHLEQGHDHCLVFKVDEQINIRQWIKADDLTALENDLSLDIDFSYSGNTRPVSPIVSNILSPLAIPSRAAPVFERLSATRPASVTVLASSPLLLYEAFGGEGAVLHEISPNSLPEVLERTTSQWWLVRYKSDMGWIDASVLTQMGDKNVVTVD